jgi:hypothetical protein
MSVMRRLVAVCLVALALPALVHAATNPVVAAAKKTATAKSSTFTMSVRTSVGGQSATMTGSGAQRGTDVKLTMRTRAAGLVLRFDALLLQEGGGYVMYMRSPAFRAQLPKGKTWLRIDLAKQGASLGIDLSSLVSSSQTIAPLEKGLVSTTRLGREVVAGRSATRYRALVDLRRAARALPAYGKQVAAIERATGIHLGRTSYDVWVAGDGRIRRMHYSTPTAVGSVRGTAASTLTFLSFDTPVSITAPPRSQVVTP